MTNPIKPPAAGEARVEEKWVTRQTDLIDPPRARVLKKDAENRWVEMELKMSVDMIEGQASGAELFELGGHFAGDLIVAAALQKIFEASSHGVVGEIAVAVDQVGNL